MSLADMYEKIAAADHEVEEQYEELSDVEKVAEEYDAAGRIMARGFMDELNKLAQVKEHVPTHLVKKPAPKPKAQAAAAPRKPRVIPGAKVTMPIGKM
jgi:hypothetical protein